jgi:hypothetical protein
MALPPKFSGHRLAFSSPSTTSDAISPHTLEFYVDYVCPYSASSSLPILPFKPPQLTLSHRTLQHPLRLHHPAPAILSPLRPPQSDPPPTSPTLAPLVNPNPRSRARRPPSNLLLPDQILRLQRGPLQRAEILLRRERRFRASQRDVPTAREARERECGCG